MADHRAARTFNVANEIQRQLYELQALGMHPVSVSLSLNVIMAKELQHLLGATATEQNVMGIPYNIVGDKSDVIAWSFNL